MIKHHPKFELIQNFVNGDLPASLSAGIAIHVEMCPTCQKQVAQLTEEVAEVSFEEAFLEQFSAGTKDLNDASECDFEEMIAQITENEELSQPQPVANQTMLFKGESYKLPRALAHMEFGSTAQIGKLARARIQLNEGEVHTSLLHIEPGGGVPEHTHNGFELTVLLDGTFSDDEGEYVAGDFIMLDGRHQHNPVSEQGCLCYTVANDSLRFTQGINKLLNPIGSFIY